MAEPSNETIPLLGDKKELQTLDFITLTIGLLGLQFACNLKPRYGSPYLLELGIESWLLSLVWLAGPLSAWSDKVDWKYGRRKPFIFIGTILIILNLVLIAYPRSFLPSKSSNVLVLSLVVFCFYILDFSINTVQCSLRSLIIDIAPIHQQETANAYAGRMISLGSITGFLTGGIDLKGWSGLEPMKALSIVASLAMGLCALITCLFVKELKNENVRSEMNALSVFKDIYKSFRTLPFPIQKICNIQFFAWIGWFPFLFYSTIWVSEVLSLTYYDPEKPDFLDFAARIGSLALFLNSVITLVFSIILPMLTKNNFQTETNSVGLIKKNKLYFIANILFTALMFSSFLISDINYAILFIALLGISWSIMMWVPFSLIGEWVQILNSVDVGIALGIHNCYVVIPQFLSNFICFIIFALYKTNGWFNGPVALIFLLTSSSSLIASYLAWKLPPPTL